MRVNDEFGSTEQALSINDEFGSTDQTLHQRQVWHYGPDAAHQRRVWHYGPNAAQEWTVSFVEDVTKQGGWPIECSARVPVIAKMSTEEDTVCNALTMQPRLATTVQWAAYLRSVFRLTATAVEHDCEEGGAVNDTHIVRLVLWMSKALGMLVVGVTAATNTATVKGAVNDTRIARLALSTSMYCAQRKKRPTTSQ
jgi:hypothetical protein